MSEESTQQTPEFVRKGFTHSYSKTNAAPVPCQIYIPARLAAKQKGSNEFPKPDVIFTHGAWTGLENPTLEALVGGLAAMGHTVLCFENTGNIKSRAATFSALFEDFPSVVALGGRSNGSVSALVAALNSGVKKLIMLSHPVSEELAEPSSDRDEFQVRRDLHQITEDMDVLFIQGDKDPLSFTDDLQDLRKNKLKGGSWWIRFAGVNHSMKTLDLEKRKSSNEVAGRVAGRWLNGDLSDFGEKTAEVLLSWDGEGKEVLSSVFQV